MARPGALFGRYPIVGAGGVRVTLRLLDASAWLPVRGAPALLAVLSGRLSLVGPRPTLWSPGEPGPEALWLTAVRPGITGPWRLSGPDASLADQSTRDLAYVRNYTIWEDLRITWRSVSRLLCNPLSPLVGRWQAGGVQPASRQSPGAWDLTVAKAASAGALQPSVVRVHS
jgi:hypothetical protein